MTETKESGEVLDGEDARALAAALRVANDNADRLLAERGVLCEALREIAAQKMRFHPIAGYQFDYDVRKIAVEALAQVCL